MTSLTNSRVLRTIPLLIVVCFVSFPAQAQYGGGSGEPNDPYLIYTAEQMNAIGANPNNWDKHFKLMADIDLSTYTGNQFNIIGGNPHFRGVFDGNGKRISNFTYTSTDTNYLGLFGYVYGGAAKIKDLGLIDPNVDTGTSALSYGERYIGSLVGVLTDGTITNCYVEGGSVSGNDYVGGLVGSNNGTISDCSSAGSVSGNDYVGGLVGYNYKDTLTNCYATGGVSGNMYVGGLVGSNWATITNSYSTGSVTGNEKVGGLLGEKHGTITNCYAAAIVSGINDVGGLGVCPSNNCTAFNGMV